MSCKSFFTCCALILCYGYSYSNADIYIPKGYHYVPATGHVYKLHDDYPSCSSGLEDLECKQEICERDGATLFYPMDEHEAKAVVQYWLNTTNQFHQRLFLGMKQRFYGNGYDSIVTADDGYVNYYSVKRRVRSYYPKLKDFDTRDYKFIMSYTQEGKDINIYLDADEYGSSNYFMCKMRDHYNKNDLPCFMTNSGGVDIRIPKDYYYAKESNHVYKLKEERKTFKNAHETCDHEGSALYYPYDVREAKAVIRLWLNMTGSFPQRLLIGFQHVFYGDGDTTITFSTSNGNTADDIMDTWRSHVPEEDIYTQRDYNVFLSYSRTASDINIYLDATEYDSYGYYVCKIMDKFPEGIKRCYKPFSAEEYAAYIDAMHTTDAPSTEAPTVTTTEVTESTAEQVASTTERENAFTEEYCYLPETNHVYKLHPTPEKFSTALFTCEQEGATLFYPKDTLEANAVINYLQNVSGQVSQRLLLGLRTVLNDDRKLFSMDGQMEDVFLTWKYSKPIYERQNYVLMSYSKQITGFSMWLEDVTYDTTAAFVCKKSINVNAKRRSCLRSNSDYGYAEHLGKCYKLYLASKSWTEARAQCHAENSELAVINSQEEADYLVNITDSISKIRIPGSFLPGVVLLGFHYNEAQEWRTITDTLLTTSGYSSWGSGQPETAERNRCGAMSYDGQLKNVLCQQKAFFICEHTTS